MGHSLLSKIICHQSANDLERTLIQNQMHTDTNMNKKRFTSRLKNIYNQLHGKVKLKQSHLNPNLNNSSQACSSSNCNVNSCAESDDSDSEANDFLVESSTTSYNFSPNSFIRRLLQNDGKQRTEIYNRKSVCKIIEQILPTVRAIIMKSNEENPVDIIKLQQIAKAESLWLVLLSCLVHKIEMHDQLGPSILAIFIEETLLPTKEQIELLVNKLNKNTRSMRYADKHNRNILVILSCLSEKVAGTTLACLLGEKTLDFAFGFLSDARNFEALYSKNENYCEKLSVLLYSLITLEKYSMSAQNKLAIMNRLNEAENPLLILSEWKSDKSNHLRHQIGFLAEYLLDNIFTPNDHVYGYQKLDSIENVNARLNDHDTSENLKLSPDGFEARNDRLTFESVRGTVQLDEGVWFFEVTLLTNGIMQIGFASKNASFMNDQGLGVGDDCYSVGYDGCRNLVWYNASHQKIDGQSESWKEGDVIGFLLDLTNQKICFFNNGRLVDHVHTQIFSKVKGFFPAASFMSFQHVVFNFGKEPFKYAPNDCGELRNLNEFGQLSEDSKFVLPKRKKLEILRQCRVNENACSICCENLSNIVLMPCKHEGFCDVCTQRLANCPICRSEIVNIEFIKIIC